jgi:hypothetical protein
MGLKCQTFDSLERKMAATLVRNFNMIAGQELRFNPERSPFFPSEWIGLGAVERVKIKKGKA